MRPHNLRLGLAERERVERFSYLAEVTSQS